MLVCVNAISGVTRVSDTWAELVLVLICRKPEVSFFISYISILMQKSPFFRDILLRCKIRLQNPQTQSQNKYMQPLH